MLLRVKLIVDRATELQEPLAFLCPSKRIGNLDQNGINTFKNPLQLFYCYVFYFKQSYFSDKKDKFKKKQITFICY